MSYEDDFRAWASGRGWSVSKRGWPDFICRYEGSVFGVEVKGGHDGLSREQDSVLRDLNAIGMPTYVWSPTSGLAPYPMTPVRESLSTLRAYISELEALIRDLMATKNEEMTKTLRALREKTKLERSAHREHVAAEKGRLGPEAYAARREANVRRARQLTDPAVIVLHADHLDLR